MMDYKSIFKTQKDFFNSGETKEYSFRKKQLLLLLKVIKSNEKELIDALKADFKKPAFESYSSEIGFLYAEIRHSLDHLYQWMRPESVGTPLIHFPSSSKIYKQPKGVCLIISPWNYPVQLMLAPLVAAISAGNTVMLKTPEETPRVSDLIEKMLKENFDDSYISVIRGDGAQVVPELLERFRFDHIFFTGSTVVGQKIYEAAAKKLVPVTLELGGKSPAIIDKSANLKVAAKRIVFGKFINAGQTCVAPDYLIIHEEVYDKFISILKETLDSCYPNPLENENLASIIHERSFDRLLSYLKDGKLVYGGKSNREKLRIEPSIIEQPSVESSAMKEEIFGPIILCQKYKSLSDIKSWVDANPNPLSAYVYTSSKKTEDFVINELAFGGGCINNSVIHLANPNLGFGGIGGSGIGSSHGKYGFDEFSHHKSIIKTATWFDLKMKYPPYSKLLMRFIRLLMR